MPVLADVRVIPESLKVVHARLRAALPAILEGSSSKGSDTSG